MEDTISNLVEVRFPIRDDLPIQLPSLLSQSALCDLEAIEARQSLEYDVDLPS